jgi:hypothetical protein
MASGAAGLAAELGARHPGLGSYVFRHRDDHASFDPTGTLTAALTLHCSDEESLTSAHAACRQVGVDVVRTGRPTRSRSPHTRPGADRPAHAADVDRAPTA